MVKRPSITTCSSETSECATRATIPDSSLLAVASPNAYHCRHLAIVRCPLFLGANCLLRAVWIFFQNQNVFDKIVASGRPLESPISINLHRSLNNGAHLHWRNLKRICGKSISAPSSSSTHTSSDKNLSFGGNSVLLTSAHTADTGRFKRSFTCFLLGLN